MFMVEDDHCDGFFFLLLSPYSHMHHYFRIAVHRIEVKNASAVDGLSKNDLFCTIVCSELDLR